MLLSVDVGGNFRTRLEIILAMFGSMFYSYDLIDLTLIWITCRDQIVNDKL